MKDCMGLAGEASNHKLSGLVDGEAAALELAAAVRAGTGLDESQVRLLRPGDHHVGRMLEPESRGIKRTMIRAHLWLGLAGAAVGILAFGIMVALGEIARLTGLAEGTIKSHLFRSRKLLRGVLESRMGESS